MGNLIGKQPFPIGSKMTNGKSVDEMGGLTESQKDQRREKAANCICPFLKTAYVQGKLDVDEVGYAPLQDCYALMDWAGAGRAAFPTEGYFKKFGVTGVPVLHLAQIRPNDTGILHAHITPGQRNERFMKFVGFANKNGQIGTLELNQAVNYYAEKNKASKKWLFAPQGEFVTILTAFGRRGFFFRKYLTKQDIENIWLKSEYPDGWIDNHRRENHLFTTIDVMMGIRILMMMAANFLAGIFWNRPKTTDPMPRGFAPRRSPPYSDSPLEPPMSPTDIAKIPGNYKRGICLWDSRSGAIQELAKVNGGKEWDLNEHPEWWQTTTAEVMKKAT